MPSRHDCAGDAAAYVLGALEPSEVETFRDHLSGCAICRDEVEMLGGAVQALPMSAPQHPVPRGLRRRLLADVRREAKARDRPSRTFPVWLRPRVAMATLSATVIAGAGALTAIELRSGSAATVIQAKVSGISGTAQVRLADKRGELIVRHLTPPAAGHVYEVWLQRGNAKPVPASVLFSVGAGGNAVVGLPAGLNGVTAILVTPEPLGGTEVPTHTPVIVANLT